MMSAIRHVKKDATISYSGKIYEVPARYIGKKIEVRHIQNSDELFLYEDKTRVCKINIVDAIENGRLFKAKKLDQFSFTRGEE